MKQCLYVIQDNLSKMVMPPFSSPNDKVAKRDYIIGALHAEIPMQDLHLYKVGEFVSAYADENVTFQLKPIEPPELLDPTLSEVAETKKYLLDTEEINENE